LTTIVIGILIAENLAPFPKGGFSKIEFKKILKTARWIPFRGRGRACAESFNTHIHLNHGQKFETDETVHERTIPKGERTIPSG